MSLSEINLLNRDVIDDPKIRDKIESLSILFVMRDPLPPSRPDVKALFGKYLFRLGVLSDLVGPSMSPNQASSLVWPAGSLTITGKAGGMVGEVVKSIRDLKAIFKLPSSHNIIQVRDRTFSALAIWLLARFRGKPFVFWMSFPMVEGYETRANEVGRKMGIVVWFANHLRAKVARITYYGWIAKRADHLFVQSDAMLEWMHAKGIPRNRMTAVPMGVDTDSNDQTFIKPAEEKRLDGRRVLIYLGTLSLAREPGFMLEVVSELRNKYPDILLVLAGDGEAPDEQAWIRSQIDLMDLRQHVWLTGWLPQTEALQLAKRAEVGLSPIPRGPLYDVSSPTKVLEYLALGIPCVGNDIPDQRLVIEASGCGICVPMRVADFAKAVEELLGNQQMARNMGSLGPAYIAKERSYQVLADRVCEAYLRLVKFQ